MEKLKLNIQLFGGSLSITASETDVSIENNQSYINLTIKATTNSTTYNDSAYLKSASIVGQNNTYSLGRINFSIGKGKTVTVYSGKIGPFDHNADGSLNNVSISASCYIVSNTQPTASASVPMSTIPRASSFTINGGTIGQTLTININRASSDFTHEVRVTYGSKTQVISTNAGTSASATLDMDFCNQIPNATTAQGIVSVATKNGSTYIGDTQNQLFTMTVPNSVVPSISSVAVSDTANLANTYGAYVQGKSDVRVITNASGSYSSSITNYTINIKDSNNNLLRQLNGNDVTLWDISYTGAVIYVEAIVTDSRGRQVSRTSQISCCEYWNPKIYSFTSERRNNDSTVTLTWNAEILNVNSANVNGKTFNIYKRQKGQSSWGNAITSYNSGYTWSNNNYTTTCDENYGWEFLLEVIDNFASTYYQVEVGTAFELINWGADGTSMAIGKVSEKSNTLEVGLDTELSDTRINGGVELFRSIPYIDFHFNNNQSDYTSRIIEDTQGRLKIDANEFNLWDGIAIYKSNNLLYSNGNISIVDAIVRGNLYVNARSYTLSVNETYVYTEDFSYSCLRLGNVVFLNINTIAFKQDIPNFTWFLTGLPTPVSYIVGFLQPSWPSYNRVRFGLSYSNMQTHWSAPINLVGDHANNQYYGTIIYLTTDS